MGNIPAIAVLIYSQSPKRYEITKTHSLEKVVRHKVQVPAKGVVLPLMKERDELLDCLTAEGLASDARCDLSFPSNGGLTLRVNT